MGRRGVELTLPPMAARLPPKVEARLASRPGGGKTETAAGDRGDREEKKAVAEGGERKAEGACSLIDRCAAHLDGVARGARWMDESGRKMRLQWQS